jgi:hypothetical protein
MELDVGTIILDLLFTVFVYTLPVANFRLVRRRPLESKNRNNRQLARRLDGAKIRNGISGACFKACTNRICRSC